MKTNDSTTNPAGSTASPAAPCSVFEAVDATSGEQYWTLGIWPTLEAALEALESCKEPSDFGCDDHDDYDDVCVVEVRERAIGWSGVGKKRATLTWRSSYDEAADLWRWHRETPNDTSSPATP